MSFAQEISLEDLETGVRFHNHAGIHYLVIGRDPTTIQVASAGHGQVDTFITTITDLETEGPFFSDDVDIDTEYELDDLAEVTEEDLALLEALLDDGCFDPISTPA